MMKFRENEEAVSPVIGVILMVAITVILAAVIAAFVFGMTGNVQTTKTVSMQAKLDGGAIVITVNGGSDLPTLQEITVTHAGVKPADADFTLPDDDHLDVDNTNDGVINGTFSVGDVISFEPADGTSGRLLIVGKWSDGAEQIILDRTF
ncbi:type IV pilin [Methanoculleus oceani]|uniref:Type IV pilin n=1 Tax=Methanoculleus oceani TaxID=2184756 RepID=A0ABD4TC16_9EURY|nr:type IV pilin N-terminal domain-containing protein [Methanoculleus sp. CWC-02]MCM2465705.1 type IV pilin [Methanoculleus sp. CWC-02]